MERALVVLLVLLVSFAKCQNIVITSNNPVIEGNDFVFVCNDTANSGETITYTVNGTSSGPLYDRVTPVSLTVSGDERMFTFSNVQRSDNMIPFRCNIGPFARSVTLVVYFRANYTSPSVTEALFCGTSFHISFSIMAGSPMSTFSLTKDSNDVNLTATSLQANATGIWIQLLQVSDAGEYVFTVSNEAGMTNVSLLLTVYCGPFLRVGNNASTTTTVTEGGSFTVDCTVTQSVPPATIYLVMGSNTPMDITNNPVRTFTDVSTSSAGTYQCRATSEQAITTFTYNIMVNQTVQNSVTPSMATLSPSASVSVTPSNTPPTDGASTLSLSVIASLLLLVAMFVVTEN